MCGKSENVVIQTMYVIKLPGLENCFEKTRFLILENLKNPDIRFFWNFAVKLSVRKLESYGATLW